MSYLSDMAPDMRLQLFRILAADARRLAALDKCGERQQFLHFARQWDTLAGAVEAEMKRRVTAI